MLFVSIAYEMLKPRWF